MENRLVLRLIAATLMLGLLPASTVLAIEARVEGLKGDPAANIRHYLDGLDESQYSRTRLEGESRRRAAEAMRAYGYYEPKIEARLAEGEPPEYVELTIDPGPRVRIETLDFRLEGDAREDPPFQKAIDDFPLAVGDPLVHAPYDSLRGRLANLSLERGYFEWRYSDRRMEVRPFDESARLYLTLDSGPRYRFGNVSISGSHIEPDRLRRLLPFTPGAPYLAGELATFNQRLGQTEWFRSVTVRPRLESSSLALEEERAGWAEAVASEGGTRYGARYDTTTHVSAAGLEGVTALAARQEERPSVPIDVKVAPADRHRFEVGVGYATDVGPRMRFSWDQPWINRYGHGLDHDLYLSAPQQRFGGVYTLPLDNPLRDSYRFQYGLSHKDTDDTRSLEATLEGARRWEFENGWIQHLYVRTTYEDFTQGNDNEQVLLLYPGIRWSRTRTRNPTFPSWGDRQRLSLEVSDGLWGSDADFVRVTGESRWIRKIGADNRVVTGLGLGAIETSDFSLIPPSLRFFAGGDNSVRGYGYESLSPRDDEGKLTGGQQLLTYSLEWQRRVTGDWWGAAFVDTGDAFEEWGPDDLKTGAGLGVRWISPVGPIRLDIAHPFDDEDNSWRLHFAIGPEF
ncbi:autotransporter assembly complex protein TamA [Halomonas icarae]|uniref:Translocation and assembly module subunit TamA n=1 Tax=Halomonas icarae TaxID=2691040 RepID=A0A7X5AL02_9GAMM|nr:autotransporter assembly complex family protein [Halomonas icarae]MDR5902119.1 autotransporter assembly complex protein TamA [Halomonas icarae]NAW12181.1 BamA/TamA family outer membrane protein [Halomonas icarae]